MEPCVIYNGFRSYALWAVGVNSRQVAPFSTRPKPSRPIYNSPHSQLAPHWFAALTTRPIALTNSPHFEKMNLSVLTSRPTYKTMGKQ